VPRIAFINKMDRTGADFFNAVETMIDRLGAKPVAVQIPIGAEDQFVGHIDLVAMKAIRYVDPLGQSWEEDEIPAELKEQAEQYRHDMIETLADHDDEIAEAFLADEQIEQDRLKAAIRAATLDISITPVLLGSAFKNKGVQPLLDAVIDYLPSPVDVPAVTGTDPKTGEPTEREARLDAPFSALAFKVMSDPFVGKLTYFRVYSGKLNSGSYVLNPGTGRKERVGRLLEMHANHREDVDSIGAGSIAAAVGLKQTTTGDTLCDPDAPVLLENIDFPDPVIDVAVEPKTKADQDKLTAALQRLAEEDPTFRVRTNEETGQTIIAGMGELHLEIIVDRLLREFKVDANVGRPQVAYRETVRNAVHGIRGRFVRQSGGRGQYGDAVIDMEPNGQGGGYEFINKIVGGSIPREYIPSIDAGIKEAMEAGVLAGFPVVDIKITLVDGSYHDVDSSEMAFKVAGSMAFKEASKRAKPVLLEPVMAVEVVTPEEYMGDVIGNINSRRGQIEGMEPRGNAQVIRAKVPLAEMFGYATDVRTMSQGRATYTMQFLHYAEVPNSIAEKLTESQG
jgi:elongation factor G